MKGYWIVRCIYHNQQAFELYAEAATAIVNKNGGKFLVRVANKSIKRVQSLKERFWLNSLLIKLHKRYMMEKNTKMLSNILRTVHLETLLFRRVYEL